MGLVQSKMQTARKVGPISYLTKLKLKPIAFPKGFSLLHPDSQSQWLLAYFCKPGLNAVNDLYT